MLSSGAGCLDEVVAEDEGKPERSQLGITWPRTLYLDSHLSMQHDDTMYLQQLHIEVIMRSRLLKWGNSLAVRIPKPVAEEANLRVGDAIEIEVDAEGSVQLLRIGKVPTLAQLVSQITVENRYPELSAGPEVGKESVEW
jgi:antitoxin MazE